MKQEFKMLQKEMDKILDINKHASNTVMKIGNVDFSHCLTDAINAYWEILGKKYKFKPTTVIPSSKGKLYFLAEPTPPPKSAKELEIDKYDTIAKIVEQLEKCNYECDAGTLINNVAFIALKRKI